jgi:hypothetical protein
MLKRYEDSINNLLESVAHHGVTTVSKGCLTLWYGQERFTAGIRSDMRTRFADMSTYIPWLKDRSLVFAELNNEIMLMRNDIILEEDR